METPSVQTLEARFEGHESECKVRYEAMNAQLKRLEGWFVALISALIAVLVVIVVQGVIK